MSRLIPSCLIDVNCYYRFWIIAHLGPGKLHRRGLALSCPFHRTPTVLQRSDSHGNDKAAVPDAFEAHLASGQPPSAIFHTAVRNRFLPLQTIPPWPVLF